ncbi:blue copper protein 1b-like [Carex rostrata]
MNIVKVLVVFTALAVTLQLAFAAGTNYTVGAPAGSWDINTNYTKWVSTITFHQGDNLSNLNIFGTFLSIFKYKIFLPDLIELPVRPLSNKIISFFLFMFPVFSYGPTAHDVWEVKENDYKACTTGSPIKKYSSGNDVIALTELGSRYFYCSISNHCSKGMKLQVSVVPNDSSSPPSPSSGDSPPSPPSDVSPPPSPTGAAAVNGIGTRLAIALALGEMLMFFV